LRRPSSQNLSSIDSTIDHVNSKLGHRFSGL
jgi:hypothetical protein